MNSLRIDPAQRQAKLLSESLLIAIGVFDIVSSGKSEGAPHMADIPELLGRRRAIRKFKMDVIPEPVLRKLIAAATLAPSAMNEQPWQFAVVSDGALLNDISRRAKSWLLENDGPLAQNERLRGELSDPGFQIFHHAPALIVIATRSRSRWAALDCALAAQNLMLAASAMDLGTCWIGMAEGWLNSSDGRKAIGLPPDALVVAPIVVGKPAEAPAAHVSHTPMIAWTRDGGEQQEENGNRHTEPVHSLYGRPIGI
jgi:nitroreductase